VPKRLFIDQILPQVVEAKASLRDRLIEELLLARIAREEAERILSAVPPPVLNSGCFLDRMTGLWRYEFGIPFDISSDQSMIWGTHMWVPVAHLLADRPGMTLKLP
jgi:hypothetical protein